ncbi:hypothetical protein NQ317_007599 [Molorchus minor]|uniref:Uncharacterized protein n=1 Tax=Molorchus minor TaxID=1323400 RepID=A0ABQ9IW39_9CUCU|nr:hypothetical protein NQ317_007599 [Molorchus minor]
MHECQMEPRMELDGFQENKAGADFKNPNNISVCDLDEETNSKLRGDAIGDTLYSQSFVLKTLLQFSDLKWSEQVEDDLCFLWDMTMEKDEFLANILCSDCDKNITEEQICIVLREMNTDDPLVLIQIVRFISAVVHISNELLFISEFELDKLKFILCNSTNNELLLKTLEVVAKLTTNFKLNKDLLDFEVILSSLSSYKLIITSEENNKFELATSEKQLACKHFLQVVSNVCAYIDRFENEHLLLQFKEHSNIFTVKSKPRYTYYPDQSQMNVLITKLLNYEHVGQSASALIAGANPDKLE